MEAFDTTTRAPMMPPCQHMICKSCVEDMKKTSAIQYKCPECRQQYAYTQVVPNRFLVSMLEQQHPGIATAVKKAAKPAPEKKE